MQKQQMQKKHRCIVRSCGSCELPLFLIKKQNIEAWKELIGIPSTTKIAAFPEICGRHFRKEDFLRPRRLHTTAQPSLFLDRIPDDTEIQNQVDDVAEIGEDIDMTCNDSLTQHLETREEVLEKENAMLKLENQLLKTWTDWKGHVKRKIQDKGMDSSRSNLSNIRLTNAEETIAKLCRFNENINRKIEIKNPRNNVQNDDVVDDTSLIKIILGDDESNSSVSSAESSSSSLKRKRETSSQDNLNDFLSSEISSHEDLKGFPSLEALAQKDVTKTLDAISKQADDSSACLKRISSILNDYCSLQAEKNKETQRHNRVIEELMREKNMIKMRSLELQELQFKHDQEKGARTLIKCEIE